MELEQMTVKEYIGLLGSDAPAPGGGAAAALSGAQGAALTAMVCALTLGRRKYEEHQALVEDGLSKADNHKARFLQLMQADTDAYNGFRAAMALPKQTQAEQAARRQAMEQAAVESTRAPLSVMQEAVCTLTLTKSLLGKTNRNAVSDLGVAALSLQTALHGAWLNVKINLPGLSQAQAAEFEKEADALLQQGVRLASEILCAVEAAI